MILWPYTGQALKKNAFKWYIRCNVWSKKKKSHCQPLDAAFWTCLKSSRTQYSSLDIRNCQKEFFPQLASLFSLCLGPRWNWLPSGSSWLLSPSLQNCRGGHWSSTSFCGRFSRSVHHLLFHLASLPGRGNRFWHGGGYLVHRWALWKENFMWKFR